MKIQAPFTWIDLAYVKPITAILDNTLTQIQGALTAPVLSCVALWIMIQGFLVIRGDVDTRQGFIKMLMVTLVVGIVTSAELYAQFAQTMFLQAIPNWIQSVGNDGPFPLDTMPTQLDLVFMAGERLFVSIAAKITSDDLQNNLSFEGAQFLFYLVLWSLFGIYDLVVVMTHLLLTLGPLVLLGFLFDATRSMSIRWIGQLISYALLLLMLSVLATVVVGIEATGIGAMTLALALAPTSADVIGLYELDMFLMTGNAIVVALPGLAAFLAGGVAAEAPRFVNSMYRRLAGAPGADEKAITNRYFITGNMQ